MKRRLLAIVLAVSLLVSLLFPVVALAADPTVTITVSALTIAITNTEDTWAIGPVEVDATAYFSADNSQDDNYSQIENTGNVAEDIEIQGTDFEGGAYDWTLAAAAGDQTYSLYANSEGAPTVYDVEVKSSSYNDLTTNLTATDTYDWSMKFTAPSAFNGSDAGANKTATVTLVASQHT
jgi:hypothetical protein